MKVTCEALSPTARRCAEPAVAYVAIMCVHEHRSEGYVCISHLNEVQHGSPHVGCIRCSLVGYWGVRVGLVSSESLGEEK